jgi:hypothetical protein
MKKIIISMLLIVLLATASSAGVVVMKTIMVEDSCVKVIILCINGYQYIHTKYCGAGYRAIVQSFEEKDGKSVPIKCSYK